MFSMPRRCGKPRRELMEQYKRYHAAPFGYNRLYQPNAKMILQDDDGNRLPDPKNIKYSPIELSE